MGNRWLRFTGNKWFWYAPLGVAAILTLLIVFPTAFAFGVRVSALVLGISAESWAPSVIEISRIIAWPAVAAATILVLGNKVVKLLSGGLVDSFTMAIFGYQIEIKLSKSIESLDSAKDRNPDTETEAEPVDAPSPLTEVQVIEEPSSPKPPEFGESSFRIKKPLPSKRSHSPQEIENFIAEQVAAQNLDDRRFENLIKRATADPRGSVGATADQLVVHLSEIINFVVGPKTIPADASFEYCLKIARVNGIITETEYTAALPLNDAKEFIESKSQVKWNVSGKLAHSFIELTYKIIRSSRGRTIDRLIGEKIEWSDTTDKN